ncbi:hypothetical protein V5799_014108 [Amblyomma americanum]|uniref:Lipocalin n=1 Tax=Amblyomma americanum TaxID=6943 RepID=A0AAQ4E3Y8_AMBAM
MQFLKENQKIWVYNTTELSNITCRLDVYTNVTVNHAWFSRSFVNKTRVDKKMIGMFLDWQGGVGPIEGKYDAMEINDTEIPSEYPEGYDVYEFQSDVGKCAVVAVLDNSAGTTATWLDLRVSDSAIEEGPAQECKDQFERVLRYYPQRERVWRLSYKDECQTRYKNSV